MQRYGRVLKLREGAEAEYDRLHTAVWPKMLAAIRQSGIRNYSIFRYERWLFSYFELADGVSLKSVGKIFAACPACAEWEKLMHEIQEPLPESGKENWWVPMKEVFRYDGADVMFNNLITKGELNEIREFK